MKNLPWADRAALDAYFSSQPSQEELAAVDTLRVDPLVMLRRPDLVVHSLGTTLAQSIASMLHEVEAVAGEEVARAVAFRMGVARGRSVLTTFLQSHNLSGGPEAFAIWQDISHSMRGPRHATALFVAYDETSVEITRSEDVFNCTGASRDPYAYAMLQGVIEGYRQIDPTIDGYEEDTKDSSGRPVGMFQRVTFRRG